MYDNSLFMFYDSNPTCGDLFVMQYFQMLGCFQQVPGVEVYKLLC
jgi:hypothetical protein